MRNAANFSRCEIVSLCIMWRAQRVVAVASAATVLCVANVPLFAQTDGGARPVNALDRSASGVAREYRPARLPGAPSALPKNLRVLGPYRTLLDSMLRRSPTFARQCQRLAGASHLTITLTLEIVPVRSASQRRARTVIDRRGGRLSATVVIAEPTQFVELVAHEFEHIIEQLDEIDLPMKAALPHSGVQALDRDGRVFETVRAHRVGLRVATEFRRGADLTPATVW